MSKTICYTLIFLTLTISCDSESNKEIEELTQVLIQLKNDTNNHVLKSLKPADEDCRKIFKEGNSAEQVVTYSISKWVDIDKVPNNSMKPLTSDAEIKVLSVTQKELRAGITNGFPSEYISLANHLKPGIKLYALQYLNTDGTEQKHRAAFFKVNNRWIIIPRTFKAFE